MKNKRFAIVLFPFAVAFLALVWSGGAAAAEFSADIVIQPKGEDALSGKIYIKGDKVRQEETIDEGETQVLIIHRDKKMAWMLSPEEKIYAEMPYQTEDKTFEEWTAEKEKKAKLLGDDAVSGLACKKYEIIEDGEKTLFWISKQFPFPLKIEDSDFTMEYRNIKEGPVPESLFELPDGYRKMTMPVIPEKE